MRVAAVVAAITFSLVNLSAASEADAAIKQITNIPAQNLESALERLARERNFQILYRSEVVGQLKTSGAVGEFTAPETLERLLAGTGLTFKYLDDAAVTIIPAATSDAPKTGDSGAARANSVASTEKAADKSLWSRLRLAQVGSEGAADSAKSSAVAASANDPSSLRAVTEEVVVSAQKRGDERLQEVPMPVSVVNAATLVESGQVRLRDFYATVPGLSVVQGAFAGTTQLLTIRGIPPLGGTPTVGVMIDDVAYGSPAYFAGGQQAVPDFDPSDLARLEVLRGPQGTLYGASSMGGLLKYVTVDPSTTRLGGHVQVGLTSVKNGNDPGYSVRGSVNVPLTDSFAIRASAFTREDAGYIDNPVLGTKGLNESRVSGGRLAALWSLSDTASLKVSALYQQFDAAGLADVTPGLGDLQQNYLPGVGDVENDIQAYSAILTVDLGQGQLTALSGYNIFSQRDEIDFTSSVGQQVFAGAPGSGFNGFGVFGAENVQDRTTKKFSQEIRYSLPLGEKVDLMVGGFYTDEDTEVSGDIYAVDPANGNVVGMFLHSPYPWTYKERAAFANVTFKMTDRLELQVGGRYGQIDQAVQRDFIGPWVPVFQNRPSPIAFARRTTSESPFTYLLTPKFKISADVMAYARFSSGFRPGFVNFNPAPTTPAEFEHDETRNYELGLKADFLDHRLSLDGSVFYTDWRALQLNFIDPATRVGFKYNGSDATVKGVELSVTARPVESFTVSGWVALNDAELAENFPANVTTYGAKGDRLPLTTRVSGHLSVQQDFRVTQNANGFVGVSASYVGDRKGNFRGLAAGVPLPRQEFPSYTQLDLRAGLFLEEWKINTFVNNVADKRAQVGGGFDAFPVGAQVFLQPRTFGVSVSRDF